jgi:hypothetical protein
MGTSERFAAGFTEDGAALYSQLSGYGTLYLDRLCNLLAEMQNRIDRLEREKQQFTIAERN